MGLSSFLRGSNEPKVSAFDAIPDEVRQAIANDLCAIIECVKCWGKNGVQSPEHAKAMIDEAMTFARSIGGKFITMAMTGNTDSFESLEWWASLNMPEAIKDIIARVKAQLENQMPGVTNGSGT